MATSTPHPSSSSSSSPQSSSTLASSLIKSKHASPTPMDVDDQPVASPQSDSSQVEILEERNGSPPAGTKRKGGADATAPAETKKPKLSNSTSTSTPQPKAAAKTASSSSKGKGKASDTPKDGASALVELKNGKFVNKQKAFTLHHLPSVMQATIAIGQYGAQVLKDKEAKLTEWPEEHYPVIATRVHESPATLRTLVDQTHNIVVEAITGGMASLMDEDDEDGDSQEGASHADRVSKPVLKALIEKLATRTNYGLEVSDLPDGLPEGVTEVPSSLQIWVWEINDSKLLPTEREKKLEARKTERVEMRTDAVALFLALPSDEQESLLRGNKKTETTTKPKTDVKVKKERTKDASPSADVKPKKAPKASTSSTAATAEASTSGSASKKKKVLSAEEEAEKEAKRIAKDKAAAEKDAKRAEKEAKKEKKAQEEAEKKAAEEKKQGVQRKQQGMMNSFFNKKVTPTTEDSAESDFARQFKPFFVKKDTTLAPVNFFVARDRKAKKNKRTNVQVKIDSDESLTLEDSLANFIDGVSPRRMPGMVRTFVPPLSVRQVVVDINESNVTGHDPRASYKLLDDRRKVPIKLLKFHADRRPGYVGTWSKTSKVIGFRTPWDKDKALLNYDVDSDEEWDEDGEEEGDAEDIESAGGRSDDEGEESEALSDDWMCDDDEVEFIEGHNGEEDVMMGDGDSDIVVVETAEARKRIDDRERKSKAAKEAQKKKKANGLMVPIVKGLDWANAVGASSELKVFKSMRIEFLNDAQPGLDPRHFISKPFASPIVTSLVKGKEVATDDAIAVPVAVGITGTLSKPNKLNPRPSGPLVDALHPRMVQIVYEFTTTRQTELLEHVYAEMKGKVEGKVTRDAIKASFKSLDLVKGEGGKWSVSKEAFAKFGGLVKS